MQNKSLHIICFDVPFPVSHGGFFDPFYKLVALQKAGVSIYLHCFEYGRKRQAELEKWCKEVFYYRRKGLGFMDSSLPYIVSTRKNKLLVERLSKDDHPILLEGTHCTYLLYKNLFPNRTIIFRLHNIEHVYYKNLAAWETSPLKKAYYLLESALLKRYEKGVLEKATVVAAVSGNDVLECRKYSSDANVQLLPIFTPFEQVLGKPGKGNFLLYHGNLSVAENAKAVRFLLTATSTLSIPMVIAGRSPSRALQKAIKSSKNGVLKKDPSDEELDALIANAQVNIVFSFNKTGIKLKLVHALYVGRHCIANQNAVANECFESDCHIADTEVELREKIAALINVPFTEADVAKRRALLFGHYDNSRNAKQLIEWL